MIKENKGITLVEIIIVVAILGIVMTTMSSIFMFGMNSFETTTDKGLHQQDERLVITKITKALRTAHNVGIDEIKQDNKYIVKELDKEELNVDSVKFTGDKSSLTVGIKIKNSDESMVFKIMLENEKGMNFQEQEKVIYAHMK